MKQGLRFGMIAGVLLLGAVQPVMAQRSGGKTLRFSGYTWEVRGAGKGGPGPNQWDPANVWVDTNGWLHVKISHAQGEWRCAELSTRKRFGYGRYQFQVAGRLDRLDQNIVLGLFDYPTADVGADGTNEIDIEFAQWGRAQAPRGNYTVYPDSGKRVPRTNAIKDYSRFDFTLNGDNTTHRFLRTHSQVAFQSLNGHRDNDESEIAHWTYAPDETRLIPQRPIPVHINLWLFQGKPPTDAKEVEIIIKQFTFVPLDLLDEAPDANPAGP